MDEKQFEKMRCLGYVCRCYRKSIDKKLSDVARDVGTSFQNVSAFEKGKNNNANIFVWYVQNGLNEDFKMFDRFIKWFGCGENGEII